MIRETTTAIIPTKENINHPAHYAQGRKYEPIDVIEDWELGFSLGNAVKYISRAGRKQDYAEQDQLDKTIEDLKKSAWYIHHEIERLEALGKK